MNPAAPPLNRFLYVLDTGVAGDHHHDQVGLGLLHDLQGFESIHFRHHHVETDDIRGQFLHGFDPLQPVTRLADDVVLLAAQHAAQQRAHQVVVIDDQDLWLVSGHDQRLILRCCRRR